LVRLVAVFEFHGELLIGLRIAPPDGLLFSRRVEAMTDLSFYAIALTVIVVILIPLYLYAKIRLGHLQSEVDSLARAQYHAWRDREVETMRMEQKSIAEREAATVLEQWKMAYETTIREDAIGRSKAVIIGKVTEHLVPYMPDFPYNPKDARFIGSPVDLIVFDGADEDDIRDVVFIEIKTGNAGLSRRQKQTRDAIECGRVVWKELRIRPE
jgi:predicted Holliday junction resolvase-like endonuclease